MGLVSFLKNKFNKKEESVDKYSKGLEKSRENFSNKLSELSKRYKTVNASYFEELEEILIESDVGISLALKIIEEVLDESKYDLVIEGAKKILEKSITMGGCTIRSYNSLGIEGSFQNELNVHLVDRCKTCGIHY